MPWFMRWLNSSERLWMMVLIMTDVNWSRWGGKKERLCGRGGEMSDVNDLTRLLFGVTMYYWLGHIIMNRTGPSITTFYIWTKVQKAKKCSLKENILQKKNNPQNSIQHFKVMTVYIKRYWTNSWYTFKILMHLRKNKKNIIPPKLTNPPRNNQSPKNNQSPN